ncbi:MAG: biotin--[acetyl-CoA-carboxylase] ligase, partial [Nevskiales bacterium]|nr:biotin--[acetyl-CoA-carboxylase] ligase [Nevskiales bacterium]
MSADSLYPLVRTLADGRWHSGARLARTSRLTRAAIAKRLRKLKDWGLELETRSGVGYRLSQALELLEAGRILKHLSAGLRKRLSIIVKSSLGSTNEQLLRADSVHDPQALLAEHQTEGRGRRGRRWYSPFGTNLYLSLAWSFPQWPATLTTLPLAVGVASVNALRDCGLREVPGLKWPNDLVARGRKLGGILIEHRGEAGGACRVVIGLGLNVTMRRNSTTIGQPWIGLCELDASLSESRNLLAAKILE